jgi:hypothetical protein
VTQNAMHFGGTSPNVEVAKIESEIGTITDSQMLQSLKDTQIRSMFALWIAGSTYSEIAEQLKAPTVGVVRLAIEKMLADSVDLSEDRSVLRQRASLQLDRYLRSIMAKALDPSHPEQVAHLRLALQITDRKIRLHGLDAPTQVNVGLPSKDELDEWVSAVAMLNGTVLSPEGDPFELEEDPETGEWR